MSFLPRIRLPRARASVARSLRAALLVAAAGAAVTVALVWRVTVNLEQEGQANLAVEADRVVAEIQARMSIYSAILSGGAGLFHASDLVSRGDWRDYANSLDIPRNYPGIQTLAYARRVPGDSWKAFEQRQRLELEPGFELRPPPGETPPQELYPITFVEPGTTRNHGTVGFDVFSQPTRRAAMEAAAASGTPVLSGVVDLLGESRGAQSQPGVLMFMPVYKRSIEVGGTAERHADLQGYVFAVFRAHDLMRQILRARRVKVGMGLYDGERLLFTHVPDAAAQAAGGIAAPGEQSAAREVRVAGRVWTASFTAPWDLGIPNAGAQQGTVLVAGLLVTLLTALTVWSLTRTREAALGLADDMTAELRATQARFERMVGGTSDGVWEVNMSNGAAYCSSRCRALLGWTAAAGRMNLNTALARIDPRDRRRVMAAFNACVRGRGELDAKLRINTGGDADSTRWFRVRARVSETRDGELYVSGALSDIQAQEEAQEREDRLLTVIESAPDIAMTCTPEGRITYLNATARQAFAAGGGEHAPDLRQAYAFAQEELARIAARLARESDTGTDPAGAVWHGEGDLELPGGGTLPVSKVVVGHRDSTGRIAYYSIVMRDISNRREVEAALHEAQARYSRALAGANDGLWEVNPVTGSFFCSERMEDLLRLARGCGPRTNLGFRALVHPDDLPVHLRAREEMVSRPGTHFWDLRMLCGDGTCRWMRMRGMSTFNEADDSILNSGVISDIHEAKEAEEELRRHRDNLAGLVAERTASAEAARSEAERAREAAEAANYSKSEFLANMSHELRTPMHAILSFASFGVDKADRADRNKLLHYFGNIQKSGTRLLSLLNDLLDLSKLEAGKMEMHLGRNDPAGLIREALTEAEALANSHGVRMEALLPAEALAAQLDPARVLQVIRNLLSNAIKFSPAGGRVVLRLRQASLPAAAGAEGAREAIELTVTDEGIGIPEDELEAVFDKFVQSSKTKTGAGGTGLGLAICREIVHAHGGAIRASNNPAPARGACFVVLLPVEANAAPQRRAGLAASTAEAA